MNISWVPRTSSQYTTISEFFSPVFTEQEFLDDENIFCCQVTVENELAAISMVKLDRSIKRLTLLYTIVFPQFRKRGINTMIKESVELFARESGADHLLGHVREHNLASLNTLKKSGFQILDEGEKFYKNGDRKLTVIKAIRS